MGKIFGLENAAYRMALTKTWVPSSSFFLQLLGQPTTTVFGFIPPSPLVWILQNEAEWAAVLGIRDILVRIRFRTSEKSIRIPIPFLIWPLSSLILKMQKKFVRFFSYTLPTGTSSSV
jgi:hypothetical protein